MKKRIISSLASLFLVAFFAVNVQAQITLHNDTSCDITFQVTASISGCTPCGTSVVSPPIPPGDNFTMSVACLSTTPLEFVSVAYNTGNGPVGMTFNPFNSGAACGTDQLTECLNDPDPINTQWKVDPFSGRAKVRFSN